MNGITLRAQYITSRTTKLFKIWQWDAGFTGVKKSLVLEPGTSKISGRTSIYFHSMSGGQVKNSVQVYLTKYISDKLIDFRTSKNLTHLARGTSEILRFFYPWFSYKRTSPEKYTRLPHSKVWVIMLTNDRTFINKLNRQQ